MRPVFHSLCLSLMLLHLTLPPLLPAEPLPAQVRSLLHHRLLSAGQAHRLRLGPETLGAMGVVKSFYEQRNFQPAWSDEAGVIPQAWDLVKELKGTPLQGLNQNHYHLDHIEQLLLDLQRHRVLATAPLVDTLADLDLLLSDAFLLLFDQQQAASAAAGRSGSGAAALAKALAENRVGATLRQATPKHSAYAALQQGLQQYRQIAARGGWPLVPPGPKLQPGTRDGRVELLRQRLGASGDLAASLVGIGPLFDRHLEDAVRRFQQRHGLEPDAVVGPATLAALNVPVTHRIRQLEANLQRWRELPPSLGERHVLVNIAGYELQMIEGGEATLRLKAIVGRPLRRTPRLSSKITHLVLNPTWHVPPGIAVKDLLPQARKDPAFLQRQKFRVFRSGAGSLEEVDPLQVDWRQLSDQNFPYRFRQTPGTHNALGQIKYIFDNPYNVYIHDTANPELFARSERTFSSGCIRIEQPLVLAEKALQGTPGWGPEQLRQALARGKEQTVVLARPLPVHLLYLTAWADDHGQLNFRKDIYGLDAAAKARSQPAGETSSSRPGVHSARNKDSG